MPLPLPRPISVAQGRTRTPFSKGVLAQSLLAAAIAPDQAFEVAREIEAELLKRRLVEVDRDELRQLVGDALERTLGERAAARYRTWRAFQESERPMILLLAVSLVSAQPVLGWEAQIPFRAGLAELIEIAAAAPA